MHGFVACVLGVFLLFSVIKGNRFRYGSFYCEGRECRFKENFVDFDKASAVGSFNDTLLVTGWGILDIVAGKAKSVKKQSDADIMFAAGFAEGFFTAKQMENTHTDMFVQFFPTTNKTVEKKMKKWFAEQRAWAEEQIGNHKNDPFWRHVSYIFAQLDGLYAGYKSVRGNTRDSLDRFAINFLAGIADAWDILYVSGGDVTKKETHDSPPFDILGTRCSALIKLLPGFEDVIMSHATWFIYANTNRIYKHYDLNVKDAKTSARKLSFSSYPGALASLDAFYQLGSGLTMLQTSNSILNTSLYELLTPKSLLAWQRVRVANMMANNGRDWADFFSRYNSGTYNNQYMVVDTKLVTPKKPLPDNTLWVTEQIPGFVVGEDLTILLQYGYFPSYNIPYFEEIYTRSGYPAYYKKYGNAYSYQLAPRAEIFRRDQSNVKDVESMKALMRSNDYKHDPYSQDNPWYSICARGDLAGKPSGCYDAKVSNLDMTKRFEADIIAGPTLGTNLPAFSWANFNDTVHVGLPETYNFSFITTTPRFG